MSELTTELSQVYWQIILPLTGPALATLGEIASIKGTGKLKGVIKIKNGTKNIPGWTTRPMLRYFEGYNQQGPDAGKIWPADKTACLPGPTLRVGVGERVEVTLINQVDVGAFGGSLDQAETGATDGCDQATNAVLSPPVKNWYPNKAGDSYPNCFHGSSSANLHFHGTHVTPDGLGDNVIVNIRPDATMTDDQALKIIDDLFKWCETHDGPLPWNQVPASFRDWQENAVKNYDLHAIWKGVRGPVGGKPALPLANQLAPVNEHNVAMGYWPQYFIGTFPNCFKVTEAAGHQMGQAPGTHWYHAHKHGSTSINLYNGLAGALIIEGQYDKELAAIPNLNLKATEKVMVVQQFNDLPDLERPVARNKVTFTNGSPVVAITGALQTAKFNYGESSTHTYKSRSPRRSAILAARRRICRPFARSRRTECSSAWRTTTRSLSQHRTPTRTGRRSPWLQEDASTFSSRRRLSQARINWLASSI